MPLRPHSAIYRNVNFNYDVLSGFQMMCSFARLLRKKDARFAAPATWSKAETLLDGMKYHVVLDLFLNPFESASHNMRLCLTDRRNRTATDKIESRLLPGRQRD